MGTITLKKERGLFLDAILTGNRTNASGIISDLLLKETKVHDIYENVIKEALYSVGEMWESRKISVATEHLASAIVETVLNDFYSIIVSGNQQTKSVVASSVENEVHQIGIKMVADIFEMHGWNVHFLGANTPNSDLVEFIERTNTKNVALSISISNHYESLKNVVSLIKERAPDTRIFIGGQGLRDLNQQLIQNFNNIYYFPDLYKLKEYIETI